MEVRIVDLSKLTIEEVEAAARRQRAQAKTLRGRVDAVEMEVTVLRWMVRKLTKRVESLEKPAGAGESLAVQQGAEKTDGDQ